MNYENFFKDKTLTVGATFHDNVNAYTVNNMTFSNDQLTIFIQVKNHVTQSKKIITLVKTFEIKEVEKIVEKIVEKVIEVPVSVEAKAEPVTSVTGAPKRGRRKQ